MWASIASDTFLFDHKPDHIRLFECSAAKEFAEISMNQERGAFLYRLNRPTKRRRGRIRKCITRTSFQIRATNCKQNNPKTNGLQFIQ